MDLYRDNEEKLREACCYGNIDAMADLIQRGVDINSCNAMNGWTALHWACQRGNSSSVDLLLRYGADPTIVNNRNQIPAQLTTLPHIKAKLGYPDPALTPSSPTNTPTPSSPTANGSADLGTHNGLKHFSSIRSSGSPPPFPSNYKHPSPPPLLSSPPSSPSPPPHQNITSSNLNGGVLLSSASSSSSPPPLPSSPTMQNTNGGGASQFNKNTRNASSHYQHTLSGSNESSNTASPHNPVVNKGSAISKGTTSRSSSISSCGSNGNSHSSGMSNTKHSGSKSSLHHSKHRNKYQNSDVINGNIKSSPTSSLASIDVNEMATPPIIDSQTLENGSDHGPSSFANIFSSSSTITSTADIGTAQNLLFDESDTEQTISKSTDNLFLKCQDVNLDTVNNQLIYEYNCSDTQDVENDLSVTITECNVKNSDITIKESISENDQILDEFNDMIIDSNNSKHIYDENSKPMEAITANLISFPSSVSLNNITDASAAIASDQKTSGSSPLELSNSTTTPILSILDQIPTTSDESEFILQNNIVNSKVENSKLSGNSASNHILINVSRDENNTSSNHSMNEEKQKFMLSKSVSTDLNDMQMNHGNNNHSIQKCSCCCCCRRQHHKDNNNDDAAAEDKSANKTLVNKGTFTEPEENEVILKMRIADTDDADFIEVELPYTLPTAAHRTYAALLQLTCTNLRVKPHNVERIRKLPNTRLRCDSDVTRLKDGAELELVVRGVSRSQQRHGGKSGAGSGGFSQQPILY